MTSTSSRRGIVYPEADRLDRPDIPLFFKHVVDALDVDALYLQGLDSARIAHAHQTGGGVFFWTTDTKVMWYDDGTNWHRVSISSFGQDFYLTNTASLTTLFTQAIDLAEIGLNGKVEIDINSRYTNNTGNAHTFRMQISYDGTVIWDDATGNIGASVNDRVWRLFASLSNNSDSTRQRLSGFTSISPAVNATVGTSDLANADTMQGTFGGNFVYSGGSKLLVVKAALNTASSSLEIKGTANVTVIPKN